MKLSDEDLVHKIEELVCSEFKMDLKQLRKSNRSRKREFVLVRQVVFYLCKKNTKLSPKVIGWKYWKDRVSVLYSVNTIAGYVSYDKKFAEKIINIQNNLVPYVNV